MFAVKKNRNGAVERGAIPQPHKDLAEGAGDLGALTHNGNFAPPPHLTDPEWLGLTAIIAWPLIIILLATLGDLRCRPGDRNTINGRDLCPTEKAP